MKGREGVSDWPGKKQHLGVWAVGTHAGYARVYLYVVRVCCLTCVPF